MREVFSLDPDRDRDPDPDLYGGFPDSAAAGLLKISWHCPFHWMLLQVWRSVT